MFQKASDFSFKKEALTWSHKKDHQPKRKRISTCTYSTCYCRNFSSYIMARRMVVVPEEFLKVFKQEPQIPLNILGNDDLLADRLNKALHQKTRNETKTASTQTQSSDHIVEQKPIVASTVINQPGINETLATPTVAFPQRAPELQSTPTEFHSTVSKATPSP